MIWFQFFFFKNKNLRLKKIKKKISKNIYYFHYFSVYIIKIMNYLELIRINKFLLLVNL